MLPKIGIILCVYIIFQCANEASADVKNSTRLYNKLMKNYNKFIIPDGPGGNAINVSHGITLNRIVSLNSGVLTLDVWIFMEWTDNRLTWNQTKFGGIRTLRVKSQTLWLPDVVNYNSAGRSEDKMDGDLNAIIFHDGKVILVTSKMIKAYTDKDRLECKMKYGSWTYDGLHLDLYPRDDSVDLLNFEESFQSNVKLDSSIVRRNVDRYDCCPEHYVTVEYTFHLKH